MIATFIFSSSKATTFPFLFITLIFPGAITRLGETSIASSFFSCLTCCSIDTVFFNRKRIHSSISTQYIVLFLILSTIYWVLLVENLWINWVLFDELRLNNRFKCVFLKNL